MNKSPKTKLAILIVLLLALIFTAYVAFREDRRGVMTVVFLDVGQGDAIFIDSPSGRQVLVDGGPGRSVLRELSKVMPFYDRSIDVVVASHPDADHISGLNDVLSRYKVDIFLEPGVESETALFEELNSKIERLEASTQSQGADRSVGLKRFEARRGMTIDLGSGAEFQILFPDRDPSGMESNTASIVARLVYGESEFLLTGDSPKSIEEYLIFLSSQGLNPGLKSDVLKAGHHGSKTSSSEAFVSAVSPQYAVISAGKDNRYGHPHEEVIKILQNSGVQILRTDKSGRITFKTDGKNLKLKSESFWR